MKNLKNLFLNISFLYFFISISILFYLIYRSLFVNEIYNAAYYNKYYVFTFALIFFSLISYLFSRKFKKDSLIIIIITLCIIYLIELVFLIKEDYIDKRDYRSKIEFYNDLKQQNYDPVVAIAPYASLDKSINEISIFPLAGISNKFTILCNENGFFSTYISDRYGFNNKNKLWDQHLDYVFLGDSFVLGSCVHRKDNFTGILNNKYKDILALNLGYRSNGPLIQLATLKEYSKKIKYKNIVWTYYEGNDLSNLKDEKDNIILNKYLSSDFSQKLLNYQDKIDQYLNNLLQNEIKILKNDKKNFYKESSLIKFIKIYRVRFYLTNKFITPSFQSKNSFTILEFNLFKKIILEAKNYSEKYNSNFIFVYLPSIERILNDSIGSDKFFYDDLIIFLKENNIAYIDIYDGFVKDYKNRRSLLAKYQIPGHYSVQGYRLIGNFIANSLEK